MFKEISVKETKGHNEKLIILLQNGNKCCFIEKLGTLGMFKDVSTIKVNYARNKYYNTKIFCLLGKKRIFFSI